MKTPGPKAEGRRAKSERVPGGFDLRSSPFAFRQGGFTLIEVMLALAILALATVVVLDQRVDIVREAASARDARTLWMLATRKIAELELDPQIWLGQGTSGGGDFADLDPEYALFTWEYQAQREAVETADPAVLKAGQKPKEIFRLLLGVRGPGMAEPLRIEAQLPVKTAVDPKAEGGEPPPGEPPPSAQPPVPPPGGNP